MIVQLGPVFFGKHHQYQANNVVPCRRGFDKVLQTEYWEVVSTRAAALASAVAQFERSEVERVAAANAQFDRAEAALSGPDASAAPQADIGQAPRRPSFSHRRLSHRRPRRCRRLIPIIGRAPPPTRSRRGS